MLAGRTSQRGFTLVEVLIALLVVGISFASLFLVINMSIGTSARSIEFERVNMLAQSYIAHLSEMSFSEPSAVPSSTCAVTGPEPGELRKDFDDIDDFHGVIDSPPLLFGDTFVGPSEIYLQHKAEIQVECVDEVVAGNTLQAKRVVLTITAPSGQSVEYQFLQGERY